MLLLVAAIACGSDSAGSEPTTPVAPISTPASEPTQPADATGTVSGTVVYRERIALTENAVVVIKLLDVSRADAPSITIGEQVIENPGQIPIAFEIEYNTNDIDDRFTYAVRAEIRENDRLIFTTTTSYPVITNGNPTQADLVLKPVIQQGPDSQTVLCFATEIAPQPIIFKNPNEPISAGFDGINSAGCTFPTEIEAIEVNLTHAVSGAKHTQLFLLPEPSTQVNFPLSDDTLSIGTAEVLQPGQYQRVLLAIAVDGTSYDLTAHNGAMTMVEISGQEVPTPPDELVCAITRAVQLPIEIDGPGDAASTGFDGINTANCAFPGDIARVTVTLTHIGSGAEHTQIFLLSEPAFGISFPLPEDTLSLGTAEAMQPGEYERLLLAEGLDGTNYDLTADQGALAIVTLRGPDLPLGVALEYSFDTGPEGWTAGFADLPVDYNPDIYELDSGHRPLPSDLAGNGMYMQGHNRSDDLFMYLVKQVGGLRPETRYSLDFSIDLATNVPGGLIGIGGAPGEAVVVKAGASTNEPIVSEDDIGHLRISVDKGNQASEGSEMFNIGDIAHPDVLGDEYHIKTLENFRRPLEATTDVSGNLWLIVGTDSGFEGLSTLYYSAIRYTLTVAE